MEDERKNRIKTGGAQAASGRITAVRSAGLFQGFSWGCEVGAKIWGWDHKGMFWGARLCDKMKPIERGITHGTENVCPGAGAGYGRKSIHASCVHYADYFHKRIQGRILAEIPGRGYAQNQSCAIWAMTRRCSEGTVSAASRM